MTFNGVNPYRKQIITHIVQEKKEENESLPVSHLTLEHEDLELLKEKW